MKDRSGLLEVLREAAHNGRRVNEFVEIIKDRVEPEDFSSFAVVSCFMEAFGLDFSQVRELSGATCLGGGAYTDEEINEIIWPQIEQGMRRTSGNQ